MTVEPGLPIYAHWDGQEFIVDRPSRQAEPKVGDVLRIEVEDGCNMQRRPFRVVARRDRLGAPSAGPDRSDAPRRVGIDIDVEPVGQSG